MVIVRGCRGSTITLPASVTAIKLQVEQCTNCIVEVHARLLTETVEAWQCDDFRPKDTQSPLKHEANRNAYIFLVIAGLHFCSLYLKLYVYRHIQEVMTARMRGAYRV